MSSAEETPSYSGPEDADVADTEKEVVNTEKVQPTKAAYDNTSEAEKGEIHELKLKHADRNDADEALQIFEEGEVITMTPEEEKKLLRKIDRHLMPLLCLVYGLNYLDKTTLSYASIMGLKVCCKA
jgi:hypothetical protein